mmetsp:Transcript_49067/g.74139  ORF Transcript_49067/g.74139 Transcript_49067/m.74139 type:complete len:118 (+) Transcript_49067:55-408(+)
MKFKFNLTSLYTIFEFSFNNGILTDLLLIFLFYKSVIDVFIPVKYVQKLFTKKHTSSQVNTNILLLKDQHFPISPQNGQSVQQSGTEQFTKKASPASQSAVSLKMLPPVLFLRSQRP